VTGLAISLALAAAAASGFATVLQALEDRQAPLAATGRAGLLLHLARRPRWLAGAGLMVLAWPVQVLALSLAPITVVQPLLVGDQLVLVAMARVRLSERVGRVEVLAALAIVTGAATVVWASPTGASPRGHALGLVVPLLVVGLGGVAAYGLARAHVGAALFLVIGAGLEYAWVDFASKLLADTLTTHQWVPAALWVAAITALGGLAFLEETSALQQRSAVSVEPVITAVHQPLPVLMALWAGITAWRPAAGRVAVLVGGLAVVTIGATVLGRSPVADAWRPRADAG